MYIGILDIRAMYHSCIILLSVFVRCHSSFVNFWAYLAFFLEKLNQFEENLAHIIYGWNGVKILIFITLTGGQRGELKSFKLMQDVKAIFKKKIFFFNLSLISSSQTADMIVISIGLQNCEHYCSRVRFFWLGFNDQRVQMYSFFKDIFLCF